MPTANSRWSPPGWFAVVYVVKGNETKNQTRKLSYRKDDRAMRPIYGDLKIFESP